MLLLVYYEFLRQPPPKSLDYFLTALNDIWKTCRFTESWKLATIILIPKPGKNSLYPSNYHSIALTSYLCRTMEMHCQQKASLVHWIQQTFHHLPMWLQELKICSGSCGQVGNLHKWGKNPKATICSCILWPKEGIQDHLEIWYHEGPT